MKNPDEKVNIGPVQRCRKSSIWGGGGGGVGGGGGYTTKPE